ncbi:hypothetical protein [Clostridium botulinum]|uniref:hypothetical protein n=1 Tax=Clostridium botulinum TaxID=1491 RepID=UPI001C9ADB23|nr:hypothetical protein [Clostridium botulinum]MBY6842808.1 hypothetical protein [Clostridium botulinum]
MLKWIKRIIITGIIIIGTLANQGTLGVTTTIAQAEDNCQKNGWYYSCDNNAIIDMNETYLHKKFIYFQPKDKKEIIKLIDLN